MFKQWDRWWFFSELLMAVCVLLQHFMARALSFSGFSHARKRQMCICTPLILALGRRGPEDPEFKVNLRPHLKKIM